MNVEVFPMICKNCGNEVADGFLYCTTCGAQLDASEPQPAYEDTGIKEPAPQPMADTGKLPDLNTDNQPVNDPGKVMGIIGMILGIAAILLSLSVFCCAYASPLASAAGIAGVVLSIIAKKKSASAGIKNGMAGLGMILSIVGLALGVVAAIAYAVLAAVGILGEAAATSGNYYY